MGKSAVKEKSFSFALRVVKLFQELQEQKEFVLSKQLLKAGTSIGANVREAINAESSPDFVHKLSIAQKECDETLYWLEILHYSGYIKESEFSTAKTEADELLKIIRNIIITTKSKHKNRHNS